MKSNLGLTFGLGTALAFVLLAAGPVQAQITAINPTSLVTNVFNDTLSLNGGFPGAAYQNGVLPWNGSAFNTTQTDPTTFDYANGSVSASFAGNNYTLSLNTLTLTQLSGNTGHADLIYTFSLDFQLGAGGLPSQATLSPSFLVSGTVQNVAGSFASVTGSINYSGVDLTGVGGTWDTVNYNWTYNTPGSFNNLLITGTPVGGTMPALSPNTVFTMSGSLDFRVDPASITVEPAPEPASSLLLGLAGVCGVLWRRFRR